MVVALRCLTAFDMTGGALGHCYQMSHCVRHDRGRTVVAVASVVSDMGRDCHFVVLGGGPLGETCHRGIFKAFPLPGAYICKNCAYPRNMLITDIFSLYVTNY